MTMLPEWWTVPYPEVSSVETAAAYLDTLGGALNRSQENGTWVLSTGQQELARGASPAELDSFVLGFALAHLICERHGPIARRAPEAGSAGAPVTTAPAAIETAEAPAETAPLEPEAATAAALASADAVPGDAGTERASLTVVREAESGSDSGSTGDDDAADEGDGRATDEADEGATDEADGDGAGEDSDETVGQGSGGGGRRRRRRR